MVDVPCLDYLWDGQMDCPGNGQIRWDKREITRNMPHCILLGLLWQSCHGWITCRIICRVVIVTDRTHYMWNYLSCATESCTMDRNGETNLTKILTRSWQNHSKSQEIWQDRPMWDFTVQFLHWWYIHTKSHFRH